MAGVTDLARDPRPGPTTPQCQASAPPPAPPAGARAVAAGPAGAMLGQGEEWLRRLAEHSDNVIFWVNDLRRRRILYVSPSYRRFWGLDPEALYADPAAWRRIVHPDDWSRAEAAFRTMADAGLFDQEYRIVLPNGDVRWVRDRGFPIDDGAGAVDRIAGIAEDVTDRKRREERVARLQAMTAALSRAVGREQVAEVIVEQARATLGANLGVVAALSDDGREFVTLRLVGYPPEVVPTLARVSVDAPTLFGEAVRRREPVFVESRLERAAISPHLAAIPIAGGTGAAAALPLLIEGRLIGAVGLGFPTDRPIAGEERDFLRAVADLCAQSLEWARLFDAERQARLAAEAAEGRFRATFEQAAVGVAHVDLDGRWLRVNQKLCDILGYTGDELLARTFQELTYLPDLDAGLANARRLVAGEIASYSIEKRYVHKDGSPIWVQATTALARPPAAEPYVIAVVEDIAERKALERLQEEFLASASHDLKNPLGAIKGQAQVLRRRLTRDGETARDRLDTGLAAIDAAATRMTALIDELVDVVRLRSGQSLELQEGSMDIVVLARRVAEEYRRVSERHTIRVDAPLPAVVGWWDEHRLERVLANLLTNAIKYSPDGGEIVVRVDLEQGPTGPRSVLAVTDRGVGIPAADLPHVFERYRRGGNVGGIAGSGIGLFGSRRIVEQHGGTIEVTSHEGLGSTFTLRLPLGPEAKPT